MDRGARVQQDCAVVCFWYVYLSDAAVRLTTLLRLGGRIIEFRITRLGNKLRAFIVVIRRGCVDTLVSNVFPVQVAVGVPVA
jgi:hypothetical protein